MVSLVLAVRRPVLAAIELTVGLNRRVRPQTVVAVQKRRSVDEVGVAIHLALEIQI